jgi:hypothetical protein
LIDEWKSGCPQFVCWCFCQCTGLAHNTQQRPFKGFGRPTKAESWEDIIKKFPDRLKEANEMVETYEYLKNKRAIEDYIKKEYQGETATPVKFQEKQNLPKGQPYKVYFNGTPAPNEKGPGQASHNMPPEGDIPDTIYYPNPKKKSNY